MASCAEVVQSRRARNELSSGASPVTTVTLTAYLTPTSSEAVEVKVVKTQNWKWDQQNGRQLSEKK